jgi:hypothetical protein
MGYFNNLFGYVDKIILVKRKVTYLLIWQAETLYVSVFYHLNAHVISSQYFNVLKAGFH